MDKGIGTQAGTRILIERLGRMKHIPNIPGRTTEDWLRMMWGEVQQDRVDGFFRGSLPSREKIMPKYTEWIGTLRRGNNPFGGRVNVMTAAVILDHLSEIIRR